MIQMTCPFCKREFPFDNGNLDREIARLGVRVSQLHKRLSELKLLPKERRNSATKKERDSLINELRDREGKLAELKSYRKSADQQIKAYEYQLFKNAVKDKYGEEDYKKILYQVEEELEAYKLSGLMRHEYTKAAGKTAVTNINKL